MSGYIFGSLKSLVTFWIGALMLHFILDLAWLSYHLAQVS